MANRTQRRNTTPTANGVPRWTTPPDLRERLLTCITVLKIPLTAAQLESVLARADRDGLSHLEFLQALIAEQTKQGHLTTTVPDRPEPSCTQPWPCFTPANKAYFQ